MAQPREERRLRRIAASYNRDAERLGQRHRLSWTELASVEEAFSFCAYCGIELEIGGGTFDHAIPLDRGGPNASYNLVRCCYQCQREKGTKTPEEYAAYRSLRVYCEVCHKEFKPRWSQWKIGYGRTCSRKCAAKSRWRKDGVRAATETDRAYPG